MVAVSFAWCVRPAGPKRETQPPGTEGNNQVGLEDLMKANQEK